MNNHEPLDHNIGHANALTAQKVIQILQKNGFYEAYETADGGIEIKGISSLKCRINQYGDGSWSPDVSVEWLSAYVIIPAVAFSILGQVAGFNGTIPLVVSALFGLGVGSIILDHKKKTTLQRLEDALVE